MNPYLPKEEQQIPHVAIWKGSVVYGMGSPAFQEQWEDIEYLWRIKWLFQDVTQACPRSAPLIIGLINLSLLPVLGTTSSQLLLCSLWNYLSSKRMRNLSIILISHTFTLSEQDQCSGLGSCHLTLLQFICSCVGGEER